MPGLDTNVGAKRARETRAALGLDPAAPIDVLAVAEQRADVPVLSPRCPTSRRLLLARDGERALLWVNGAQPLVRQRFTLAHELGHLRIGHDGRIPVDSVAVLAGETRDPREVQANAFAAELLAPRAGVTEMVAGEPGLDDVARIAARYGISLPAALFRLIDPAADRAGGAAAGRARRGMGGVRAYLDVPEFDDGLSRLIRVAARARGIRAGGRAGGAVSVADAASAAGCRPGLAGRRAPARRRAGRAGRTTATGPQASGPPRNSRSSSSIGAGAGASAARDSASRSPASRAGGAVGARNSVPPAAARRPAQVAGLGERRARDAERATRARRAAAGTRAWRPARPRSIRSRYATVRGSCPAQAEGAGHAAARSRSARPGALAQARQQRRPQPASSPVAGQRGGHAGSARSCASAASSYSGVGATASHSISASASASRSAGADSLR